MTVRTTALILTLALTLLAARAPADAQKTGKVYRIGVLALDYPPTAASLPNPMEGLRQGLRELGYVEGRNVFIEWRYAARHVERLSELAVELVRLKVDVIHVAGRKARAAASKATTTIPIVMVAERDPVAAGDPARRAHPHRNVTGLTASDPETSGTRLRLLRETLPALSRVAALWDSASLPPASARAMPYMKTTKAAAHALGVQLHIIEVHDPDDFTSAFETAITTGAQALHVTETAMLYFHRARLADLAAEHRLPAIGTYRPSAEAGLLMSYGADRSDLHRRAAGYVDKLLKGAKPSDLPMARPTKFELVINLKTAKALGLTIPASVLKRADKVIE